jgi:CBS domain-containing protein
MIGHRITGLPVVSAASDIVGIVTKAICCGVPGPVKRVPVIDRGGLVGIISRANSVRALVRNLPRPDHARTVSDRPMPPPGRSVSGAATEGNSLRQGIFSSRRRNS